MYSIFLHSCAGFCSIMLIIYVVAYMVLCFRLVLKIGLMTSMCFKVCWTLLEQCKSSSVSHGAWPVSKRQMNKRLGRDTAVQCCVTPADQNYIPHCMASCSAYKTEDEEKEKQHGHLELGHLELGYLSSQAIITCDETLLSQRQLNIFLLKLCLHTQFSLYLPHCLCLNPQVLSLLPSNSLPMPLQGMSNWLVGSAACHDKPTNSPNTLAV